MLMEVVIHSMWPLIGWLLLEFNLKLFFFINCVLPHFYCIKFALPDKFYNSWNSWLSIYQQLQQGWRSTVNKELEIEGAVTYCQALSIPFLSISLIGVTIHLIVSNVVKRYLFSCRLNSQIDNQTLRWAATKKSAFEGQIFLFLRKICIWPPMSTLLT